MSRQIKSPFAATVGKMPLLVLDSLQFAKVSGAGGPHGGWSLGAAPSTVSSDVRSMSAKSPVALGPHGGW